MPPDDHTVEDEETTEKPLGERIRDAAGFQNPRQTTCDKKSEKNMTGIQPFFSADRFLPYGVEFVVLRFEMSVVSPLLQNGAQNSQKIV